jgi:hypothetical protein
MAKRHGVVASGGPRTVVFYRPSHLMEKAHRKFAWSLGERPWVTESLQTISICVSSPVDKVYVHLVTISFDQENVCGRNSLVREHP